MEATVLHRRHSLPTPLRQRRVGLMSGVILAAALLLTTVATPAAAGPASAAPAVPQLHWTMCPPDSAAGQAGGFQCAQAEVPLDYRNPTGTKITLSVVRRPA